MWPNVHTYISGELNVDLTDSSNNYSIIFQQPESTTVDTILLRQGVLIGTGVGISYEIGIQGVGITGYPNGAYLNSGTAFSHTTSFSSANNQRLLTVPLSSGVSLTSGEFYALTVKPGTGVSTSTDGILLVNYQTTSNNFFTNSIPYFINFNSKSTDSTIPVFGLRSSSRTYGHGIIDQFSTYQIRSNSSPDEIGVKFTLDKNWGNNYKISGLRLFYLAPTITNGNYTADIIIYDSDGSTVLQSSKIYLEQRGENATPKTGLNSRDDLANIFFSGDLATLKTGKQYYLSFRPNDILNGLTFYTFYTYTYAKKQDKTWLNDLSMNFAYRTDSGTWTVNDNMDLIIQFYIDTVNKNSKAIIAN